MSAFIRGSGIVLVLLVSSRSARAADPCSNPTAVREIAACAVATHPLVAAERERLASIAAARTTAGVLLPSHPELSFSMAERRLWQSTPGATPVLNFYLTLSQKIQIAGERSTRLAVVDAQTKVQLQRVAFTELTVAAETAETAIALAAAGERAKLGETLRTVADRLTAVADARRESALISDLEAVLLTAEATRISFEVDEVALAMVTLGSRLRSFVVKNTSAVALTALPPTLVGSSDEWVTRAMSLRADLGAVRAEADAQEALAKQFERERAPTVTLSAFLQSDGFGERVLGGGISIPIFLPSPLGPSRRGEIDGARARERELSADASTRERQVRHEVEAAASVLRARERQASQYSDDRIARARTQLSALVEALGSNKIAVREGLYSTRALIDLLERGMHSRLAVWQARIALARAAALPLEEVLP